MLRRLLLKLFRIVFQRRTLRLPRQCAGEPRPRHGKRLSAPRAPRAPPPARSREACEDCHRAAGA